MPQRRTARKKTGTIAGSKAAAATPASASLTPAASAHQHTLRGSAIPSIASMTEQLPGRLSAQRPGTGDTVPESRQQQPVPFDLMAALQGREFGQAADSSARPAQAQQASHSVSAPADRRTSPSAALPAQAARQAPEAHRHKLTQQTRASHAVAPHQAAGISMMPGQTPGVLGKRAAEPGSEPPAKRAKRSDGSLLGIANMVIRDFARRRLGSASTGNAGVRPRLFNITRIIISTAICKCSRYPAWQLTTPVSQSGKSSEHEGAPLWLCPHQVLPLKVLQLASNLHQSCFSGGQHDVSDVVSTCQMALF